MITRHLTHARVILALHALREAPDPKLLLLHELGSCSPSGVPQQLASWPGAVWALDFTGHGGSTHPRGGGYSAEILAADADVALSDLGPATVVGSGLGAYVALLIAGARPELVRGAILRPGRGLKGGGPEPSGIGVPRDPGATACNGEDVATDPEAIACFEEDVRPPGYAALFVRQARHLSKIESPIVLSDELNGDELNGDELNGDELSGARPPWLVELARQRGVIELPLATALQRCAEAARAAM